jgi:tetratricopeptide (TPR) repeat protein
MTSCHRSRVLTCVAAAALIAAFSSGAHAQATASACGPLSSPAQYGPYDYRNQQDKLPIVEIAHFTPIVESLVRGQNSGVHAGGDIDYTLRAFPNHHRALDAMVRYGEKMRSDKPPGTTYTVECYFERALRFRPDDTIARLLYASFLAKRGRTGEAVSQLEVATSTAGTNAFSHYNIGLVYFDLKQFDKALVQAHKAMELGFPQTLLAEQLKQAGKWSEPVDAAAVTPAPAASAQAPAGGSH